MITVNDDTDRCYDLKLGMVWFSNYKVSFHVYQTEVWQIRIYTKLGPDTYLKSK